MTLEEMFQWVGKRQPYADEYQGYWLVPPRGVVADQSGLLQAVVYLRSASDGPVPGLHLANGYRLSELASAYLDMLSEPILPGRPIAGGYEALQVSRYTEAVTIDVPNATILGPQMIDAALPGDTLPDSEQPPTPLGARLGWCYLLRRPDRPAQFYHPYTHQRLRLGRPSDLLEL